MVTYMIITNTAELFKAMLDGKNFRLNSEGQLCTQSILRSKLNESSSNVDVEKQAQDLQINMAALIEKETSSSQGPKPLERPLLLEGNTFEELLEKSRVMLCNKMIEFLVEQQLSEEPIPIKKGVTGYLQGKWEKTHPGMPPDIKQMQQSVQQSIQKLQNQPGHILSQLAYGYTLTPRDLEPHMRFLEESIKTAVSQTWNENHRENFDSNGCYDVFIADAVRERPVFKRVTFKPEEYDNQAAAKMYTDILTKTFPDPSMASIVGICLSQTILPEIAAMIMGVDTPHPLNPYLPPHNTELSNPIMTMVNNQERKNPRTMVTTSEENILIAKEFGISLQDFEHNEMQEVGIVSFIIKIPKAQFPLTLGSKPDLTIVDMQVERTKAFMGNN